MKPAPPKPGTRPLRLGYNAALAAALRELADRLDQTADDTADPIARSVFARSHRTICVALEHMAAATERHDAAAMLRGAAAAPVRHARVSAPHAALVRNAARGLFEQLGPVDAVRAAFVLVGAGCLNLLPPDDTTTDGTIAADLTNACVVARDVAEAIAAGALLPTDDDAASPDEAPGAN
jgi:hypothetical protein